MRRNAVSVVASPVLVGAVTTLVLIVGVVLAYGANSGLPFVPTYNIKVEVPNGANLVDGNEVRIGGFRVGIVQKMSTRQKADNRTVALLELTLDKVVQPLTVDSRAVIRPRSTLGLKYLDILPGTSPRTLEPGDTLPLSQSARTVEFDDLLNTFDEDLRQDSETSLQGFGDAFTARGYSINRALQALPGFFGALRPVMDTLNDPRTELDEFFKQIGNAAAEAAPVAETQAEMFVHLADTFEAFSACPECLRATIEKTPPTLAASSESFRVQRPFLRDFTELTNELRPAAVALRRHLPEINSALIVGQPVLRRTPTLNRNTSKLLRGLDDLAEDPNFSLGLRDLDQTLSVTKPLLGFVAPYQTVCNYANYFFTGLGDHQSEEVSGGNIQRVLSKSDNRMQDDRLSDSTADRPVDVPKGTDPQRAEAPNGEPLEKHNTQPYGPAIDARGNADCQIGQFGYPDGPLVTGGRYPEARFNPLSSAEGQPSGGSHVMIDPNTPGLAGPTFTGLRGLRQVDENVRSGR